MPIKEKKKNAESDVTKNQDFSKTNRNDDVTKNPDFSKTNRPKSWTQRRNDDIINHANDITKNPDFSEIKESKDNITKELLEDNMKKIEGITKNKLKLQDIKDNIMKISICEWYSYNGKRCRRTCDTDSEFCNFHNVLKEDFKILKKEEDCSVRRDIKIIPRNKDHVKGILTKLRYDDSDIVDVYLPGGSTEEGSIAEDDYIELTVDETKYYYESKKGSEKAKSLRIMLTEDCVENAVISVRSEPFCRNCYIKKSKKIGYPHLTLFGYKDE
jgi:hypothetical protein